MKREQYKIFILSNDEYESLHEDMPKLSKEDLKNSGGFANPETKEAFVRKFSDKDQTNEVIQHEIDELLAETSPHEKNGYRFGWFKKAFGFSSQPAVNVLAPVLASALLGPAGWALAGLGGAATSAVTQKLNTGSINPVGVGLSAIGGGLLGKAMTPGIAASKAVGGGYLGQVGSGLQSAVGIQSGAQKALAAENAAMSGVTNELAKTGIKGYLDYGTGTVGPNITPAASGVGAGVGAALGTTLGNINNVSGVQAPATVPSSVSPSGTNISISGGAPSGLNVNALGNQAVAPITDYGAGLNIGAGGLDATAKKTLMEKLKESIFDVAKTAGTSMLLNAAVPQPTYEQPQSVEDLKAMVAGGGTASPLGAQAREQLSNILASEPSQINAPANDAYYADVNRRIDLSYQQAKQQLDAVYNQAGMLGSGEYLDQMRQLTQWQADAKDSFVQSENQRRYELARTEKYNAIRDALGVDDTVMQNLIGVTGLDVEEAAQKYGADVADVQKIREALGSMIAGVLS